MKLNKFDLQLFAVTLPDNPDTSKATAGKDYLLSINTGTALLPVWTLIGGQRSSSLGRTASSIDTSNKTSGGWASAIPGLKKWTVDLDALALLQDAGLEALEAAFDKGVDVNLKFQYPDLRFRTGWATISDFSLDTPHDKEAALKGKLEGNGALSAMLPALPSISPLNVTVSKAATTDQSFAIAPTSTTVSSVSNGVTPLTVTTNYTYSAGVLVIKGTYLTGLTVGTITINVLTGNSETLTITVTLTA